MVYKFHTIITRKERTSNYNAIHIGHHFRFWTNANSNIMASPTLPRKKKDKYKRDLNQMFCSFQFFDFVSINYKSLSFSKWLPQDPDLLTLVVDPSAPTLSTPRSKKISTNSLVLIMIRQVTSYHHTNHH